MFYLVRTYNKPLIPLLFSLIIGLSWGHFVSGFYLPVLFTAVSSVLFIVISLFKKKSMKLIPLILFICIGFLLIYTRENMGDKSDNISNYCGNKEYRITGIVCSSQWEKNKSKNFIINKISLKNSKNYFSGLKGRVKVSCRAKDIKIERGDKVSFTGKIQRFRNFSNPGGFDYCKYMSSRKIYAKTWTKYINIISKRKTFMGYFDNIRSNFESFLDITCKDKKSAAILKALITGDKSEITLSLRSTFNRTGVGHLLAISGMHMSIVAFFSFFILSFCLRRISIILRFGMAARLSAFFSILPVFFYGMISGWSPSSQRAVLMIMTALAAIILEKEHEIFNTTAAAAFFILILKPESLFNISFQLSFAAVIAILYGFKRFSPLIEIESKMQIYLINFFLVSVFAIAGTLPLTAYYFNLISFAGLWANLISVPLIGFAVVPLGLISICVLPFSNETAVFFVNIASGILKISVGILEKLAGFSCSAFHIVTPSIIFIICYYIILICSIELIPCFYDSFENIVKKRFLISVIIIALIFITIDSCSKIYKRFYNEELRVTAIDVGQGSSQLIHFPNGKIMLIDGGGYYDNNVFDIGHMVVAPLLWRKNILKIDYLVLTHPESDHMNGLIYIINNFAIGEMWINGDSKQSISYKEMIKSLNQKKIKTIVKSSLCDVVKEDDVCVEILNPSGYESGKELKKTNNKSLVLKMSCFGKSFLFTGDIMKKAEKVLVKKYGDKLKANVLMVPHHGSKTSGFIKFIEAVSPDHAIVSAGWNNRYKMPAKNILEKYSKEGSDIIRTDKDGAVTIIVKDGFFDIHTVL